jgi:tRNA-splicing endonuclease subunit Sen2
MTTSQIWLAFQTAHLNPPLFVSPRPVAELQLDNPFIINYIVYHHYRSLGWVVRGGIKFCVDYMLYKRGPVFNHAESVRCLFISLFLSCVNSCMLS